VVLFLNLFKDRLGKPDRRVIQGDEMVDEKVKDAVAKGVNLNPFWIAQ
jgi:hypothetical protein